MSLVMVFIMKRREKQLPTVIPILPRKMKIAAIMFANENFIKCLIWSMKPLQAEEQKFLPETAMYEYADAFM